MKASFIYLLTVLRLILPGGLRTQKPKPEKVLIVYLSRTSNTRAIAEIIHQQVGGTMVRVELEKPYPEDYKATVQQVEAENISAYLPPLKTRIDDIVKDDVVFLGFPTWGMQLPPPVKSFLHQYDLKGKTVIPFNTNAGHGPGSSFDSVRQLCPGSKVLQGLVIKGGEERAGKLLVIQGEQARDAEEQVKLWLQQLNFH